jgi:hypothetical protein
MMRRCLKWLMLAAAPPNARLALAHFDEDHGAARLAHYQIDLAAAAPGRPIIARQQLQAAPQQMRECPVLGRVAGLLGGGRCRGVFVAGEFH